MHAARLGIELGHLVFFQRVVEGCAFKRAFHFLALYVVAAYVKVHSNLCFATGTKALFRITELFRSHVLVERSLIEQLLFCHSQSNAVGGGVMFLARTCVCVSVFQSANRRCNNLFVSARC